jgi:hypothetical protein
LRSRSDHVLAELLTDPPTMEGLQKAMDRVSARNAPPSVLRNPTAVTAANAGLTSGGVPGMLPAIPFMGAGQ